MIPDINVRVGRTGQGVEMGRFFMDRFGRRAFLLRAGLAGAGALTLTMTLTVPCAVLAQSSDPVAIVQGIFRQYQADKVPSVPWSPAVRGAMRRNGMEADPILNAQDIDVRSFNVRQISRGSDRAEIEARFVSFGRNMVGRFDFRLVDGQWTVANYRALAGAETGQDLRRALKLPRLN